MNQKVVSAIEFINNCKDDAKMKAMLKKSPEDMSVYFSKTSTEFLAIKDAYKKRNPLSKKGIYHPCAVKLVNLF